MPPCLGDWLTSMNLDFGLIALVIRECHNHSAYNTMYKIFNIFAVRHPRKPKAFSSKLYCISLKLLKLKTKGLLPTNLYYTNLKISKSYATWNGKSLIQIKISLGSLGMNRTSVQFWWVVQVLVALLKRPRWIFNAIWHLRWV